MTKNIHLKQINTMVGAMIPGVYFTYLKSDTVQNEKENGLQYCVEILNTLTSGSALSDHRLLLKQEIPVMLSCNLNPLTGHVNDARYIIEKMTNNIVFLQLATV